MFEAEIPGGTVTVMTAGEVPVNRRRPLQLRILMFGVDRLREIVLAPPGDTEDLALLIGLSDGEVERLEELSDAALCAVLASWTLPGPVPDGPAALRALPSPVWDALTDAAVGEASRLVRMVV